MRDPAQLAWLDPPPAPAWAEAVALLGQLGALGSEGGITDRGRAIRSLPLPPRLAAAVLTGAEQGAAVEAARRVSREVD